MAAALAISDSAIPADPITGAIALPPHIPEPPASLSAGHRRALIRSGELAIARGLSLIGRGVCRVPGHEGAPVWVVGSGSRSGLGHLVWVEHGRIQCDCEARKRQAYTCSHAQLVRLLIVAERAQPASVPTPVEPEPEPEPPSPAGGPSAGVPCPSCAAPTDADEIAQLGECLRCLQVRAELAELAQSAEASADERTPILACCVCGAVATGETSLGVFCDDCAAKPAATLRRELRAAHTAQAKQATAARVIQREKQRARAHIASAASPRAAR